MTDSYGRYEADRYDTEAGGAGFMMGLLAGTVLGAGLGMLLAPKAGADLRGQLGEQARNFSNKASEQYRRASETASNWAERGREMVNQARENVSGSEQHGYSSTSGSTYSGGNYGGSTGSGSYGSSGSGSSGSYGTSSRNDEPNRS
jgi:gas vesicle protein